MFILKLLHWEDRVGYAIWLGQDFSVQLINSAIMLCFYLFLRMNLVLMRLRDWWKVQSQEQHGQVHWKLIQIALSVSALQSCYATCQLVLKALAPARCRVPSIPVTATGMQNFIRWTRLLGEAGSVSWIPLELNWKLCPKQAKVLYCQNNQNFNFNLQQWMVFVLTHCVTYPFAFTTKGYFLKWLKIRWINKTGCLTRHIHIQCISCVHEN